MPARTIKLIEYLYDISEFSLVSVNSVSLNIEKLKYQFNLKFYGRHVDDISIIYDDPKDNAIEITEQFNKLHPKLQFVLEREK